MATSATSDGVPKPLVSSLSYDSYGTALKALHTAVIQEGPCGNLGSRECALNHPPFLQFLRDDAFDKPAVQATSSQPQTFDLVQPIIPLASEESGLLNEMFVAGHDQDHLDFTSPLDESFASTLQQQRVQTKIDPLRKGAIRQLSKALKAASAVPLCEVLRTKSSTSLKDAEEGEKLCFRVRSKIELRKSRQWWLPSRSSSRDQPVERSECVRCHAGFSSLGMPKSLATVYVLVFLRKPSGELVPLVMRPNGTVVEEQCDEGLQGGIYSSETFSISLLSIRNTIEKYCKEYSKIDNCSEALTLHDLSLLWNVTPQATACPACLNEYVDLCISDKGGQRSRREEGKMDERMSGVRESNIRITGCLDLLSHEGIQVRGLFCHGRTFARMYKTAPKGLKRKGKEPTSRATNSAGPQKMRRSRTGVVARGCAGGKRDCLKGPSSGARRISGRALKDAVAGKDHRMKSLPAFSPYPSPVKEVDSISSSHDDGSASAPWKDEESCDQIIRTESIEFPNFPHAADGPFSAEDFSADWTAPFEEMPNQTSGFEVLSTCIEEDDNLFPSGAADPSFVLNNDENDLCESERRIPDYMVRSEREGNAVQDVFRPDPLMVDPELQRISSLSLENLAEFDTPRSYFSAK
eukprot:CAMPEP_0113879638 /NCGR_PEP_ID=MMETSP0780_2-20120614/7344_1 /TAXON_ID=652834 /ORGANISM="Palpitomonas bilix" /LENGTH=635 /DNA_ID=CAMNT_0000866231 /DNA_START=13 /DNA_END=1920 /DNA_ORIENTATION=- /assembly_acc=CAM_ASM_000599